MTNKFATLISNVNATMPKGNGYSNFTHSLNMMVLSKLNTNVEIVSSTEFNSEPHLLTSIFNMPEEHLIDDLTLDAVAAEIATELKNIRRFVSLVYVVELCQTTLEPIGRFYFYGDKPMTNDEILRHNMDFMVETFDLTVGVDTIRELNRLISTFMTTNCLIPCESYTEPLQLTTTYNNGIDMENYNGVFDIVALTKYDMASKVTMELARRNIREFQGVFCRVEMSHITQQPELFFYFLGK